jgi:anti-anti-sigma factor
MTEDLSRGQRLTLSGEYDIARRQELTALFRSQIDGGPVTIDMTDVSYVDSTFLAELAAMRFRLNGSQVTLVGVQPNIARVLQLAKLDRFFVFR